MIVFRTDLFRRYPMTLVYLVKPGANVDKDLKAKPEFAYKPEERATHPFFGPIFQGELQPDVVFFCFDINPKELDQYWLILDEPPSDLRFRNDIPSNASNGANFAAAVIDTPTRVAISGKELQKGEHP